HDHAVPGAPEALRALKARGKSVLAVTNNSSLSQHALAERFRKFGLPLDDHEVFSAMVATVQYVAHEKPEARVLVFGNPGLRAEVVGAHSAGMDALLVLTGVASGTEESLDPPEHLLPSVADLTRLFECRPSS